MALDAQSPEVQPPSAQAPEAQLRFWLSGIATILFVIAAWSFGGISAGFVLLSLGLATLAGRQMLVVPPPMDKPPVSG